MHLTARLISYYNPISAFFQELKLPFRPAGGLSTQTSPVNDAPPRKHLQGFSWSVRPWIVVMIDLPFASRLSGLSIIASKLAIRWHLRKLLLNFHPIAAGFFALIHLLVSLPDHLVNIPVIVRTNAAKSNGDGNVFPLVAKRRFLNFPAHPV